MKTAIEKHIYETMCGKELGQIDWEKLKQFTTDYLERFYGKGTIFAEVDKEKRLITVDFRPMCEYIEVNFEVTKEELDGKVNSEN